mmetsp:Transcript_30084/g.53339  ORF Transcript_30084/g.53339 Transcript_30084/m.53339 type:complete len:650 (+) Transcript_30084:28-1977(+)
MAVNHARFVLDDEHPDVSYLKQDEIGLVLSRGLGELYMAQPHNPLHFLGNWLVNYAAQMKHRDALRDRLTVKEKLKAKKEAEEAAAAEVEKKKQEQLKHKEKGEDDFRHSLESSLDLDELLGNLAEHLANGSQASGSYIGILEKVKRKITELDDDQAHFDPDAPEVIRYIAASQTHNFMIGKTLSEDKGIVTYDVWKAVEVEDDQAARSDEEGQAAEPEAKVERLKVSFVPDVVNDTRMYYFDVPKLGSYFCLPMTYKSCLVEGSFDQGLEDAYEYRRLKAEQEAAAAAKSEHTGSLKDEAKDEHEEQPFEELKEKPYKTEDVKLIVCLDTLGQDRVFTQAQRDYCENWVKFYRDRWEEAERACLRRDIEYHLEKHDQDLQTLSDKQTEWSEAERVARETAFDNVDLSTLTEEAKGINLQKAVFNCYRDRLLSEDIAGDLRAYRRYKVVKHMKLFQIAFYTLGFKREDLVEPGTNRLFWKKARTYIDEDFFVKLRQLNPIGQRHVKPPEYALLPKLEADLEKLNAEEIDHYSLALGLLYRLLQVGFKLRIADVRMRRDIYAKKVEAREEAKRAAAALQDRKRQELEDARESHRKAQEELDEDAPKAEFDESAFLREFDEIEMNQSIDVPPEVEEEKDEDVPADAVLDRE